MELVYLWVEEYKNIYKQGFNFSPRFECKYENNELTIIEKKENEYIKNFFGDNINVTAIVGKNGSGKTKLLKYFLKLDEYLPHHDEFYNDSKKVKDFICVFFNENVYYISNIEQIQSNLVQSKYIPFIRTSYYLNNLDNDNSNLRDLRSRDIRLEKNRIISIINALYMSKYNFEFYPSHSLTTNSDFKLSTFIYIPIKIEIIPIELKKVYEWRMGMFFRNVSNENRNKIVTYKKEIFDILEDDYHKFLAMSYLEKIDDSYNLEVLKNKDKLIFEYNKLTFKKFEKITESDYYKYFSKRKINLKDINDFERFIYFGKDYNDFFDYDLIDKKKRRYNHLSSGEQTIFGLLLNIYFQLNLKYNYEKKDESHIFCLDEPDISLHPNWQKKYMSELLSLCKKFDKKIHLLITTHSPFILSDIPKQNMIFLDDYDKKSKEKYPNLNLNNLKDANCINVSSEIDIKPFGANIHELLSHGFFMEDGLMGEFAKNKIRTIKVAHRYILHRHKRKTLFTQSSKRCRRLLIKQLSKFWQIQEIIGEPFLQKIVKNQLEEMELILLGKNEAIDNEIARLQALKASLR